MSSIKERGKRMKKSVIPIDEWGMTEYNGKPVTDSIHIAQYFEKEHYNVLRDIENLDCSPEFTALNFEGSYYKDSSGRKLPRVIMTKDGFVFLAMGYRGKRAAEFKELYIARFNEMEQFISELDAAKLDHPHFTEAVMQAHDEPKHFHFSVESDMINRIVTGKTAKQLREEHGIESTLSIRPCVSRDALTNIVTLQKIDVGLLYSGIPYQERKEILTKQYNRLLLKAK